MPDSNLKIATKDNASIRMQIKELTKQTLGETL